MAEGQAQALALGILGSNRMLKAAGTVQCMCSYDDMRCSSSFLLCLMIQKY